LLLLFVAWSHASEGSATVIEGLVFIILLFACVVLHELSHSLIGRRYGYHVKDITLLPIGGVSAFERIPTNPRQELAIAAAGPLASFVIAAVLFIVVAATQRIAPLAEIGVARGSILERLVAVNFFLGVFNLLPAFPMDGGRMLRAFLAQRMDYAVATQTAARIGQGIALILGFFGLLYNPFLMFIALFVYIGAEAEAAAASMRSLFHGLAVRSAMVTRFSTLAATDPISRAVVKLLEGYQHDFPVVGDDGQVVGVLTRKTLVDTLARGEEQRPVGEVAETNPVVLSPDSPLDEAVETLRSSGLGSLPVVNDGRLVGVLTLENIGELAMIHNARARAERPSPGF
jgi:Zn-dependent protease